MYGHEGRGEAVRQLDGTEHFMNELEMLRQVKHKIP